jgi:hypothetical protein
MTEAESSAPAVGSESALDDVVHLLHSSRRRVLLQALADCTASSQGDGRERVALTALAQAVAARETGTAKQRLPRRKRRSAMVGLRQNHLPLLDAYDVVVWHERDRVVEPTDRFDDVLAVQQGLAELTADRLADLKPERVVGNSRDPDAGECP